MMHVGVAGLGKMGAAIAHNLLDRGYLVSVWDRTQSVAEEMTRDGATTCADPESLVASVDATIAMLWGDEVAREISLGRILPAAREGQLVIECSTLSPLMYQTLADAAVQRRVDFLACPVIGSVDEARKGTLVVLPGGTQSAFERARELLGVLGSTVTFTGSPAASGFLKLASNSVLGVIADSIGELLAIGERAGVDRGLTIDTVLRAFERAPRKRQQLIDRDTKARFSANALLKDLQLARGARESIGVDAPVMDCVLGEFARTIERDGVGDCDYIAVALAH